MDSEHLKDFGRAMKVQQNQVMSAEEQLSQMHDAISALTDINDTNLESLDVLISRTEELCEANGIDTDNITADEILAGKELADIVIDEPIENNIIIRPTDTVDYKDEWNDYMVQVNKYANNHSIDLIKDPYATLLSRSQHDTLLENIKNDYYAKKPKMDKYDYIIAAACGVFAGVIDSIFVGSPTDSILGKFADELTDKGVMAIAKKQDWKPKDGKGTISGAIGALEEKYRVNYDQTKTINYKDITVNMSPSDHHIKSLSHSPDIFGMISAISDQLKGTSTFFSSAGKIEHIPVPSIPPDGNLIEQIIKGFTNWLFHCISDVAGSSGSRGPSSTGRGSGLSIPFFELFQGADIGKIGEDQMTIADATVKMFKNGYDARFGAAMAIPVVINELLVRICFTIKRHYYHKEPWSQCIPIVLLREINNPESNAVILRRMLLASYGSMCLVDFGDAAICSGGVNSLDFLLHLNFVAWKNFAVNLAISGVMEMRLNYSATHLNVKKLDSDLKDEWERLYLGAS